ERRLIAGKVLHSGCIICIECHKSIGEGAFEQHDDDIFCVNCYNNIIKIKLESSSSSSINNDNSSKKDEILINNDSLTNSTARYGPMK
ncbi:unnamed protein product, partial [Rotaria sp. Silwood1]